MTRSRLLSTLILVITAIIQAGGQGMPVSFGPVHKDSSLIVRWADSCMVQRGFVKISDTTVTDNGSNRVTAGTAENAKGPADGRIVSLGDRGSATYYFDPPLKDGRGPDFAVFENGFAGSQPPYLWFLELAVVEVSSDGMNFFLFPAVSKTQTLTQVPAFGQLDTADLHNLAGKYAFDWGTPFDLAEMSRIPELDLQSVTHIRITDVVGSLSATYGTADSNGNLINDPFPTPFRTSGFDLDALAILGAEAMGEEGVGTDGLQLLFYPNPAMPGEEISIRTGHFTNSREAEVSVYDLHGRLLIRSQQFQPKIRVHEKGLYFISIQVDQKTQHGRLIVR